MDPRQNALQESGKATQLSSLGTTIQLLMSLHSYLTVWEQAQDTAKVTPGGMCEAFAVGAEGTLYSPQDSVGSVSACHVERRSAEWEAFHAFGFSKEPCQQVSQGKK